MGNGSRQHATPPSLPAHWLPIYEHPGSGPVGELSPGSGHYLGTDAAKSKQGYGQRLAAQPPELGRVQRRQQGSFTDESITSWGNYPAPTDIDQGSG